MARATGYFFGESDETTEQALPPITMPERLGACLLLASTIALGLYPRLLMDLVLPASTGRCSSSFARVRGDDRTSALGSAEIVIALAGFLVLILDLGFLRRAMLAIRFRVAVVFPASDA